MLKEQNIIIIIILKLNNKSLKINNINEEPKIENVKGTKYYYYNNFEIKNQKLKMLKKQNIIIIIILKL